MSESLVAFSSFGYMGSNCTDPNGSAWQTESCTLSAVGLLAYMCIAMFIYTVVIFFAVFARSANEHLQAKRQMLFIVIHAFWGFLFCFGNIVLQGFNQVGTTASTSTLWVVWGLYNVTLLAHCLYMAEALGVANKEQAAGRKSELLTNPALRRVALGIAGVETALLQVVYLLIPWAEAPTTDEPYWTQLKYTAVYNRKDFWWFIACWLNIIIMCTFLIFPIGIEWQAWQELATHRRTMEALRNPNSQATRRTRTSTGGLNLSEAAVNKTRLVRLFEIGMRNGAILGIVVGSASIILWILMCHEKVLGARAYLMATQMSLGWFFQFSVMHIYFPWSQVKCSYQRGEPAAKEPQQTKASPQVATTTVGFGMRRTQPTDTEQHGSFASKRASSPTHPQRQELVVSPIEAHHELGSTSTFERELKNARLQRTQGSANLFADTPHPRVSHPSTSTFDSPEFDADEGVYDDHAARPRFETSPML